MPDSDKCFVVMPFGTKQKNNGSGETYNFDKVYRVIIQRAISNVKMEPLRADETEGSRIIHADMFKDLRDRPVVLVDLSLLNPNVFYELGIRHVMSPTGTVLMANEETIKKLPFDLALSRTISYRYDGQHLDWEEVERVVPQLQAAIEEARRGAPDSPVYAFLKQVLSPHGINKYDEPEIKADHQFSNLNDYQEKFAEIWLAQDDISLSTLIDDHNNSSFGVRALGYYGAAKKVSWERKKVIAEVLFSHEEYDLATDLFKALDESKHLAFDGLLKYGSSISQSNPTIQGAKHGLSIIKKARKLAEDKQKSDKSNLDYQVDVSFATQNYAAMLAWIWSLSRDDEDLDLVITELRKTIKWIEKLNTEGKEIPLGRYAQNLVRLSMFLRIAEKDRDRIDIENNFQKVLALKSNKNEPYISVSYLRWYQIFILADMGKYDDAQKRAIIAIPEDIKFANKKEKSEVGRRQYSLLRDFLEQYSRYWRDSKSIARISQLINTAHIR